VRDTPREITIQGADKRRVQEEGSGGFKVQAGKGLAGHLEEVVGEGEFPQTCHSRKPLRQLLPAASIFRMVPYTLEGLKDFYLKAKARIWP